MSTVLSTCALVVVIAAAARSTWSPCGWSMLSTITPLSERGRGHRFGATASWFVGGATVGGAVLGGLGAFGALGVHALGPAPSTRLAAAGGLAALAAALDAGVVHPPLPHHRRQVDEEWLDEFRPWVYAAGFGLQIGTGLATYIMTGAVYLVVGLGAFSESWVAALAIGTGFGFLRGLAVLTGVGNVDRHRLAAFHRRFAALDVPVRRTTTAILAVVAASLIAAAAGAPGFIAAPLPVVALVVGLVGVAAQRAETVMRPSAVLSSATELDLRSNEPTTA